MVRRKGFEPPTFWFVAKHSIQLSYRRICDFLSPEYDTTISVKSQQFFEKYFLFFLSDKIYVY